MGNHKFRISDMIPNAWFYKLRDMGKTRNKNKNTKKKKIPITTSSSSTTTTSSSLSNSNSSLSSSISTSIPPKLNTHRKSHYFTRDLSPTGESYLKFSPTHSHDFPGKSPKQKITTKNRATNKETPELVTTTVSAGCGCRATVEAVRINNNNFHIAEDYPVSHVDSLSDFESLLPEYGSDHNNSGASWSSYSSCQRKSGNDIVFNFNDTEIDDGFDSFSKLELPQIITKKPTKSSDSKTQVSLAMKKKKKKKIDSCTISEFGGGNAHGSLSMEGVRESRVSSSTEQRSIPVRRISASTPGLRIRTNSPRIIGRKFQNGRRSCRRSLSESLAVVKTSVDPQRDFTDSMVDMIVENNIRGSEDLEDLLACYLQLNSDVYHELIIKVFKQIWFDLEDIRLK